MGHKKNRSMDFCRSGKSPLTNPTGKTSEAPKSSSKAEDLNLAATTGYNNLKKHEEKYKNNKSYKEALAKATIKKDQTSAYVSQDKNVDKALNDKKQNKGSLYDKKTPLMKTYDEAYETRGKKYQGMDKASYIKEAKAYNKKEYNTEKPSDLTYTDKVWKASGKKYEERKTAQAKRDATGVDKKRNEAYAKKKKATEKPKVGSVTKSEKAKGNLVVNKELMKKAEKNQRVKKATTTEKKEIGPKNRVTVKSAKANKKAGVKEAKQKGYETRKDRREAVRGARKAGKAGVKEARKDKRDLKKAEKNTKKSDKREVKTAIKNAGRASKVGRLKNKKSTVKRRNKIEDLEAKQRLSE